MSKEMGIILLGLWITLVPYLGVPSSWKTVLVAVSGIGVMLVGFLLRTHALSRRNGSEHDAHNKTFVENSGTADSPAHDRKKEGITALN